MNNIYLNFPTAIFVKDNILLNELEIYKKPLYDYFEKHKSEKSFNASILTNNSFFSKDSSYASQNNILKNLIFKNLINEIYNNCVYFCSQLGFSEKQIVDYDIQNIWANLIKKYDYHGFHTHADCGNALISGVFYVTAPETAILRFKNIYSISYIPQYPDNPNELSFYEYSYNCIPGRMILFRSHTLHGYNSHLSDKDKISIAFNFGHRNLNK
jgi:uncharacterized protein (TIGR02466 family)